MQETALYGYPTVCTNTQDRGLQHADVTLKGALQRLKNQTASPMSVERSVTLVTGAFCRTRHTPGGMRVDTTRMPRRAAACDDLRRHTSAVFAEQHLEETARTSCGSKPAYREVATDVTCMPRQPATTPTRYFRSIPLRDATGCTMLVGPLQRSEPWQAPPHLARRVQIAIRRRLHPHPRPQVSSRRERLVTEAVSATCSRLSGSY